MGKKKTGRPSWFKLFLHQKSLIDAVTDETAGRALKAALNYFESGEIMELDPLSGAVFAAMKPYIDEAFRDFQRSVDTGRTGSQKRWGKEDRPPIGPLPTPIGVPTEAETEAEAEKEGEGEEAAKPPKPARPFPPSVADVRAYCDELGYTTIDPERFVSYYSARQWMAGHTPITDWRAAVDSWHRIDMEDKGNGKAEQSFTQFGSIGTRL